MNIVIVAVGYWAKCSKKTICDEARWLELIDLQCLDI